MTSEMTRPTDDELEAMASKLDAIHIATGVRANRDILGTRPIEAANDAQREAATMLRACKGRVRVKPLEWSQWGNEWDANSPFGTFTVKIDGHSGFYLFKANGDKWCDFLETVLDRSSPEDCMAQAYRIVEARILAALDPSPDHSDWNAAIEAAAQAVPQGWCQPSTSHIEMDVDLAQGIQAAILQLKKGPLND